MKRLRYWGLGLLLIVPGCATDPGVHAHASKTGNFADYRTFTVLPVETSTTTEDRATAQAVGAAAQKGAKNALVARGLTEAGRDDADLVFYLHGKVMTRVNVQDWGFVPIPSDPSTDNSRIYVEAFDNRSKKQVWQGWLTCTCRHVYPERVQNEVQVILEQFPSGRAAQTAYN